MPLVNVSPHMRRALRDVRLIWTTEGVDGVFYAFRVIEVVRQHYEPSDRKGGWKMMHDALGTTEEHIKPLTDVAKEVRHGEEVVLDPGDWLRYSGIAFTVLSRFIEVEGPRVLAGRRLQARPSGVAGHSTSPSGGGVPLGGGCP
jgi:hypothetical protein